MPALKNPRHERFAIEISKGLSQFEAYTRAGYKADRGHSSRLAANGNVQARIAELQARTVEKIVEETAMDRAWVLEELRANYERHKETNGAVANRALELIGKELGLFVERSEITHKKDKWDELSGRELALEVQRKAQLLLEDLSEDEEEDDAA
jgi:phage terminase small subunit